MPAFGWSNLLICLCVFSQTMNSVHISMLPDMQCAVMSLTSKLRLQESHWYNEFLSPLQIYITLSKNWTSLHMVKVLNGKKMTGNDKLYRGRALYISVVMFIIIKGAQSYPFISNFRRFCYHKKAHIFLITHDKFNRWKVFHLEDVNENVSCSGKHN